MNCQQVINSQLFPTQVSSIATNSICPRTRTVTSIEVVATQMLLLGLQAELPISKMINKVPSIIDNLLIIRENSRLTRSELNISLRGQFSGNRAIRPSTSSNGKLKRLTRLSKS